MVVNKRRPLAFTLIELLVVVAIVLALLSIAAVGLMRTPGNYVNTTEKGGINVPLN